MEEKKSSRKKSILILSAMVVLLIAILCFGATTFAKYITKGGMTAEEATVAKWGFEVKADASKMFGEQYKNGTMIAAETTDDGVDIKADTTSAHKVVAPGAKGSLTFSIKGQAEVMAKITLAVDADSVDVSIKKGEAEKHPIVWTLKTSATAVSDWSTVTATADLSKKSLAEITTAMNKLYQTTDGKEMTYKPNEKVEAYYELSWEWPFVIEPTEGTDEEKQAAIAEANEIDTVLANAAQGIALPDGYSEAKTTLKFGLSITVEQVQNTAA